MEKRASSYLMRSILAENSQCKGPETGHMWGTAKGPLGCTGVRGQSRGTWRQRRREGYLLALVAFVRNLAFALSEMAATPHPEKEYLIRSTF